MLNTRWEPLRGMQELSRLHHEMNRMFDRFGGNGGRTFSRGVYPPLNLWEDDGNLYIEAELPGLELSDLEIFVSNDNQLTIKGERKHPEPEKGSWHRQERGYGSFSRAIELPHSVESDNVSAKFKDGVLTITLPTRAEVKPRRIEVKSI